jgi:hypothetical protein
MCTPNPNFNGTDVITVQVCDLEHQSKLYQSNTDNYSTPVNDAPMANDDTVALAQQKTS